MTDLTQTARELPELPAPWMRELNPYHGSGIDPYAGATHLQWYTADQMREFGAACATHAASRPADGVSMPREIPDALTEHPEYINGQFSRRNYDCIYRLLASAPTSAQSAVLGSYEDARQILHEVAENLKKVPVRNDWQNRAISVLERLIDGACHFPCTPIDFFNGNACEACVVREYSPKPTPDAAARASVGPVTDEMVARAWMAYTGRDKLGPTYANDWTCMIAEERRDIRMALEAVITTPSDAGGETLSEPLKVFDRGPWKWTETGQQFTGADLDGAAFAAYQPFLTPPNPGDARLDELKSACEPFIRYNSSEQFIDLCVPTSAITKLRSLLDGKGVGA